LSHLLLSLSIFLFTVLQATENVEHPAGDQEPAVAESSCAAEERAEHADNAEQHGANQRSEARRWAWQASLKRSPVLFILIF
jgi:hypothetical protein